MALLLLAALDASQAAPGWQAPLWSAPADTTDSLGQTGDGAVLDALRAGSDGFGVLDSLSRLGRADTTDSLTADPFAADSLGADSLGGDSLALVDTTEALPDTGRAARLLPPFRRDLPTAQLGPRRRPLSAPLGPHWERRTVLDSSAAPGAGLDGFRYIVREQVGGEDVRVPVTLGLDAYRQARLRLGLEENFRQLASQSRQQGGRGGLGFDFDLPGGQGNPIETIFGSNRVDLRVDGQANVDVGFDYAQNEQQEAATGRGGSVAPDFGQELGLSITGTIGDKLEVDVSYDTQNDFDFQNQVRLTYTGYEDEILQRFEAGNVFLPIESDLIRGGQRLFGLKADLQVGGLGITAVASQQDAESDELVIEGGSQTTPFTLNPVDYDDDAHFYLGYYFYNRWNAAHANPPNANIGAVKQILELEVYRFTPDVTNAGTERDVIQAAALVDLGEAPLAVQGGEAYLAEFGEGAPLDSLGESGPPAFDTDLDRYPDELLEALRDQEEVTVENVEDVVLEGQVTGSGAFPSDAYAFSPVEKLRPGQDYEFDPVFGYLSMKQSLSENDVLAVAFTAELNDGTNVTVGDYGQGTGDASLFTGRRIILKLLRGRSPQPDAPAWDLTMRNVYRAGGRGLTSDDFELQVLYAGSGQTPERTLPGVDVGQQQTLLQTLGLDRLNQQGQRGADDLFDFLTAYTINPSTGRIIFPYREPFGQRLRDVLTNPRLTTLDGLTEEEAVAEFVFDALYDDTQANAARQTNKATSFRIEGSSRSSVQEFYDLGFAVVDGSVEVTSGGSELVEGADYSVDYTTGTVTITNASFLTPGRDIRINYERQQFLAIQKKTLLGLRAAYEFSDRFAVGATWMRLSERPLIDKYRIGEEPIQNSIWGVDLRYEAEPLWVTRLVDRLPLIQTRAPSTFELRGEFAQLNPGSPETLAFERSQERLDGLPGSRAFKEDEQGGSISYIDDFEGSENTFNLLQPSSWRLAANPEGTTAAPGAGPDSARTYLSELSGDADVTDPLLRSNWRGLFGWYSVLSSTYRSDAFDGVDLRNPAVREVRTAEVFPDREQASNAPQSLQLLDLYLDPTRRGPYNFNEGLTDGAFAERPRDVWGGMTQRLPDGYRDFEARNNIEFVEFIFSPLGGKSGDQVIAPGARLFVDLGRISEDVLPNGQLNTEDGLLQPIDGGRFGRRGTGQTDGLVNVVDETRRTEDLGLDGLASGQTAAAAAAAGSPYDATEDDFFADFLATLPAGGPIAARARRDPAGDDYHSFQDEDYFNDGELWPGGATLQERFSQFFAGLELNSLEAQTQLAQSGAPGNSRTPDTEDINLNAGIDTEESFFRYEVPLNPAELVNSPFFVGEVGDEDGPLDWYLVRIPVRTDRKAAVGGIDDFRQIEAVRVWTDGHTIPATLRFASLDLVGSQWLKSAEINAALPEDRSLTGPVAARARGGGLPALEDSFVGPVTTPADLFVATVNNEENPDQYLIPNGTVRSFTRDPSSGRPLQTREQALVLRADDLFDGSRAALFKPFTRTLDLTKYSNLRMFVHAEGFEREDSMRVFIRLGASETEDYYELEQPVYAWSPPPGQTVAGYVESLGGDEAAITAATDSLWQTNVPVSGPDGAAFLDRNSVNLVFGALNVLKVERDLALDPSDAEAPFPVDRVYAKDASDFADTDIGDFAPEGAVLRIRGTPTLQNISTVVIGLRNARGGATTVDAEAWFNELRVSGYDEDPGWSAYARASLRLADVADVTGRFSRQTDGFGELSSGLGDRSFQDEQGYSLTANLNAHKLLPERFGWQLPVSLSLSDQTTTPRFSPRRGDITVEEEVLQIEQDSALSAEARASEIAEVRAAAETSSFRRTIRVPISKSGSRSPLLRYTLDGLALTYTNTREERRSPTRAFDDATQWGTTVSYNLTTPRPKTVRPFWFAEDAPVVGLLGGLRFNVLPQSVRLTADANRSISENQDRARRGLSQDTLRRALEIAATPGEEGEIARFLRPTSRRHAFGHSRGVEVQYSPFEFLSLGYRSNVRQSFDDAGVDSSRAVLIQRTDDPDDFAVFEGCSFDEVFGLNGAGSCASGDGFTRFGIAPGDSAFLANQDQFVRSYPFEQAEVRPFDAVTQDIVTGEREGITEQFTQGINATVRSPIERVRALSFLQITPVTYATNFTWQYLPLTQFSVETRPTVATLATQASLRTGLSLKLGELAEKIPLWRRVAEAQEAGEAAAQEEKRAFDAELAAYRQAKAAVREAEAALADAEAAAAETGEPVAEVFEQQLAEAQAADTLARPSPGLPLPNPLGLLRRGFLALTGPRDISLTYDGSFSGTASNVRDPGYSLLSALTGTGPGLGFRLGLDRRFPTDAEARFYGDDGFRFDVRDEFRDQHGFGARTALDFSQTLRVDLTWDVDFSRNETLSLGLDDFGTLTAPNVVESGSGQATVVALGGSYEAFFDRQYDAVRRAVLDAEGSPDVLSEALTNNAVAEDFRGAFSTSMGSFGTRGFFALPLPNWQVNYSGVSDWPLVRALAQSATLRHGYSATYDTDYQSFTAPPVGSFLSFTGDGGFPRSLTLIPDSADALRTNSSRVSQRFQPLVGLDLNFQGGFTTNVAWNQSDTYSLAAANAFVNQSQTDELSLRVSFSKTGFRLPIPFVRRRLNNQLRFTLTVAQAKNLQRRFALKDDVQLLLSNEFGGQPLPETFQNPTGEATTRLTAEPQISYTISSQVTASVFVRYERFESEGSRVPSTTNLNGGFNFRVSFSN